MQPPAAAPALVEMRNISIAFGDIKAALGPAETKQVGDLILSLTEQGIGIFLISHDIHGVFDLAGRVYVMKNGRIVGSAHVKDVTKDDVLGMIILGKCPPRAIPGPEALSQDEPFAAAAV
jgi:D-xylose transport system ATP-binding protein